MGLLNLLLKDPLVKKGSSLLLTYICRYNTKGIWLERR